MGLTVITGRSGTGKTKHIFDEITSRLNKDTSVEAPILLMVPEQMSFQTEYEVVKHLERDSFSRLQVLGFKRLAHRVFQEVGGATRFFVNDITTNMMITKILEDKNKDLKLFNRVSNSPSFASMLYEIIKEFKSFNVTPDLLEEVLESSEYNDSFKSKLSDIKLVYEELNHLFKDELVDDEDYFKLLAEKLPESDYIKDAEIYIDGFHMLTNLELTVLQQLLKHAKKVTMLFTLENPQTEDMSSPDHLFHLPFKTFKKIISYANEEQIDVTLKHFDEVKRFDQSSELHSLESNFQKINKDPFHTENNQIHIKACDNPKVEIHEAARTILDHVKNKAYNYNDFCIFTNSQDVYYPLIKNVFRQYGIPVFIDDKKQMLDHSVLNFIHAALEIVKTNWRHEAVFRAIKTELFIPIKQQFVKLEQFSKFQDVYRNHIDLFENYCLSHGVSARDWYRPEFTVNLGRKLIDEHKTKTKRDERLERIINEVKDVVAPPLITFIKQFNEAATVKGKITALYELLLEIDVPQKLELYEKLEVAASNDVFSLNSAKKHKQVWNHVVELFEQIVKICGDFEIKTNEFIKILETGLVNMNFAIVPPAIDQVYIGTLKRSRFEMIGRLDDSSYFGVKNAFILGVNEGEIPKMIKEKGLLSEQERETLAINGMELFPTIEETILDENFIIYTVLASPSEQLFLSYSLSDSDGKEAFASEIITEVKSIFPNLQEKHIYEQPDGNDLTYLTTINQTTSTLLKQLHLSEKGYSIDPIWYALKQYYLQDEHLRYKLKSLQYKNEPVELDREDAKTLYGDTINASISRIEKFNNCPYSHFIDYGLRLKERDIHEVAPPDIGDLYHHTLERITQELMQTHKTFADLKDQDVQKLVEAALNKLSPNIQRNFFNKNKRNQHLLHKVSDTLVHTIRTIRYQDQFSNFKTVATEEEFSNKAKRFTIKERELMNGTKLNIKGFIDRIDISDTEQPYLRVIDYKSSDRKIDYTSVYNRTSLQLLVYLDVALNHASKIVGKDILPAGAFYSSVKHSKIDGDTELTEEEIEQKHREAYKLDGYTIDDRQGIYHLDQKLLEEQTSDIINVKFKKNGDLTKNTRVVGSKELDVLRTFANKVIEESAFKISEGNVSITPQKNKQRSACTYCKFRPICKFDHRLEENNYKYANKVANIEDLVGKIERDFGGESNE